MDNKKDLYWKQNTLFGLLMGSSFCLASLIFVWSGRSVAMNPQLNNITTLLTVVGIFMGLRKYRDEALGGSISYARAFGIGMFLLAIASIVYALYTYILYSSSSELFAMYKNHILLMIKQVYENSPMYNTLTETFNTFLMPVSIAIGEFVNHIFSGIIFTLLLAWIIKRSIPREFQQN